MTHPFTPRVGGILSADIAVPEHEREVAFYSRVLTTGDSPLWRDDLMNNLGMPIIGLGARGSEFESLPLRWMPHIQVADVAAGVERALALGGAELMHAKGDDGESLWAVLQDRDGVAFGLVPVVSADQITQPGGAGSLDDAAVGRISWFDLTVADAPATRDFYREVVGWTVQDVEMDDAGEAYVDYNMLGADGSPAAGICHARGVNEGLPPAWMMYLPVGDLAESLRRVRDGGGRVIREMRGSDGGYAYAVIEDPVGACLALVAG